MLIFKASKMKTEWREAAPSGYMLQPSVTGYINAKLFYEYGEYFIKFLKESHILTGNKKVLLLLDMHKSHLFNLDFMEYMKANNVEVCSFPPHCTHVLQPLDNVPFAEDYPLDVAGEEEGTTQGKEDMEDDEEDKEDEEDDKEDDEEEHEDLEVMLKVSTV